MVRTVLKDIKVCLYGIQLDKALLKIESQQKEIDYLKEVIEFMRKNVD